MLKLSPLTDFQMSLTFFFLAFFQPVLGIIMTSLQQTANTAGGQMQTRGCSGSGRRSGKTIDQQQQCDRHTPACEGGRRGSQRKCRNMAQKVE